MSNRVIRLLAVQARRLAAVVVVSLVPVIAVAQQATSASPPWEPRRNADGQPDIQGSWSARGREVNWYSVQEVDSSRHSQIMGVRGPEGTPIVDPPDGRIPYQPWAAEKAKFLFDQHLDPAKPEYFDPVSRGFLPGVPRVNMTNAFRILQPPGYVVIIHEFGHVFRVIPVNGRARLGENIKLWMGDSHGRWEGRTLVVETTNNNDHTFFDGVGSFHSDALRVVERWTFADPDRIDYEVTIEDPKVFTRPWTMRWRYGRNKPQEQWEFNLWEDNKTNELLFGNK